MAARRVLLTGGSGFVASQILKILIAQGYSVRTTVRSQVRANQVRDEYRDVSNDRLDFAIVEDLDVEGAFDDAVISDPPFEAVIHTASPFRFNVTDIQKELIDPAVMGTISILKAVKKNAPTAKQVVMTSSFVAMVDPAKGHWPGHKYSEEDWNPTTLDEALQNPISGYRGSKTFAEKAAWDFVRYEQPNFTLTTINPPLVFGPLAPNVTSLNGLNTSNEFFRDLILGKFQDHLPPTIAHIWVDVRDLAQAHVRALEVSEAANSRFFVAAGMFSNREIVRIIRSRMSEYSSRLPPESIEGGDYPQGGIYGIDNSRTQKILRVGFRSLEESVIDTVKSIEGLL
ncbi:hypothetical protein PV08_05114 [Exophiala spinifera]|uniref:NAD-dependent epimerase/dehydratase domain-containing protein n=1 Tax=Exophiala spinifera TaxID=91928 RepID=A0A0D2C2S4_9EURO|nr:uncharacterized protein PV08_05114 [Exophiala spinifera]KIW17919.1 hypothetical protein PV08_05114 [Exophiala spinifera]